MCKMANYNPEYVLILFIGTLYYTIYAVKEIENKNVALLALNLTLCIS